MINKIRRNNMNDLLNDIATLEKITKIMQSHQALYGKCYFLTQALNNVTKMLAEKSKILKDFERDQMTYEAYSDQMKGVGFDDVA